MVSTAKQQAKHFWSEHLEQWHSSGLSQADYCRQHSLCRKKFSYRKRQSDMFCDDKTELSTGFSRVQVNAAASVSGSGLSLRFNNEILIEGITSDNLLLIHPNPHIESRQSFSWIKSMLLLLAKQIILNFQVIFSFYHLNFECFVLITIKHRFLDGSLL